MTNDGVERRRPTARPGMGLRLAGFEALQAGGLLEFGAARARPLAGAARRPVRGAMSGPGESRAGGDQTRLRVLIVDDHDVVHWGFRMMLGNQPWVERTLSARTGAEAYALADRYKPDVALVDLFIGEESGPEICQQLRERSPTTQRAADQRRRPRSRPAPRRPPARPASSPRTGAPPTSRARCGWSASG